MQPNLASRYSKWMLRFVLLAAFFFLWHCSSLKELAVRQPEVSVMRVRLNSLSPHQLTLLLQLQVSNPNPIEIQLAGFDYRLMVNKRSVLAGKLEKRFSVPANGADTVEIPLGIPWRDLFALTREISRRDSAYYLLEGGLVFDLPVIGETRIPVRHRGTLPIPRIPRVAIESVKIDRLSVRGADLVLHLRVENENPFPLPIREMQYRVQLNGLELMQGTLAELQKISSRGTSRVVVPVHLNIVNLGNVISRTFTDNQPSLNYRINGQFFLFDSPDSGQGLPFEYRGNVTLVK